MKIAVFGGAGLAGTALIELATQRGHVVRALVRESTNPPASLTSAEIVRGDALDQRAVAHTIVGADVVISTLGGFRGPASIAEGTANIIAAMRENGPERLVVLQGVHVDFPGDPRNPAKNLIRAYLTVRCRQLLAYAPKLRNVLQEADDIAWTLVRIPRMVEGPATGAEQLGRFAVSPVTSVKTGDVAATLLELAETTAFLHDAPMLISSKSARTEKAQFA
jgi:putative NADH-flavin reductase